LVAHRAFGHAIAPRLPSGEASLGDVSIHASGCDDANHTGGVRV
jgi:hypothetical protein